MGAFDGGHVPTQCKASGVYQSLRVFQRRGRDATFCQITLKTRLFLFQSFNVYGSG